MKFKLLCEKTETITGISVHCLDDSFKNRRVRETVERRIEKFLLKNITKSFDDITEKYLGDLVKDSEYVGGPISNFSKKESSDWDKSIHKYVCFWLYGIYEDRSYNFDMPCKVAVMFA